MRQVSVIFWHSFFNDLLKHTVMNTTHTFRNLFTKTLAICGLLIGTSSYTPVSAQGEQFGHTLNAGVGLWYYGYVNNASPFLNLNYEIDVARDFTLAPSIGFASSRSDGYYYGGESYYYRETVLPVAVKGTYYFDRLLQANPDWDFYLAASLGFVYDKVVWQDGYRGDRDVARTSGPLFLDLHIGAEYHISRKIGMFLDLSSGVSTLGLAFHRVGNYHNAPQHHTDSNR